MTTQTAIRERPILFSSEMIRAILRELDPKMMTRRLARTFESPASSTGYFIRLSRDRSIETDDRAIPFCPYGQPGDLLWVRETWQDYCPLWDGGWCGHGTREGIAREHRPVYKADDESKWLRGPAGKERPPLKWKPSIFMPRWASRITLEITGVRVERLQQITEEDAFAEGIDIAWLGDVGWLGPDAPPGAGYSYVDTFRRLWDSLNAKRAPWESDPFVWVISFQRINQ